MRNAAGISFRAAVEGQGSTPETPGNYFAITGQNADTLTIVTDDGTVGGFRSPIDGIQIVGVAIPEPAALTFVMGAGLLGLLRRRRNS